MAGMARFICSKCGYKHLPKKANMAKPEKCPWCSSPGSLKMEQTADELLRGVDEMA